MASTKLLLIEQQMHPFSSSTISSSSATISSLSMPMSPNSLTMTAVRNPCWLVRICFTRVVFPLPRKPVTTVTGNRVSDEPVAKAGEEAVIRNPLVDYRALAGCPAFAEHDNGICAVQLSLAPANLPRSLKPRDGGRHQTYISCPPRTD